MKDFMNRIQSIQEGTYSLLTEKDVNAAALCGPQEVKECKTSSGKREEGFSSSLTILVVIYNV